MRVLYVDRDAASLAQWGEVREVAAAAGAELRLHLTRTHADELTALDAVVGRPNADDLSALLAGLNLERVSAYACGPAAVTSEVRGVFVRLGVADENVPVETFFSPASADLADPRDPSTTGPHRVRVGTETHSWDSHSGSLLDVVEANGIPRPAGRSSAATCRHRT